MTSIKQRLLQRTQSLGISMNNQYSIHDFENTAETTGCCLEGLIQFKLISNQLTLAQV